MKNDPAHHAAQAFLERAKLARAGRGEPTLDRDVAAILGENVAAFSNAQHGKVTLGRVALWLVRWEEAGYDRILMAELETP